MSKIRKFWISREEFYGVRAGDRHPLMTIDFDHVGGLTAGSIPFADAGGFLAEDNTALFWDAAQDFLGVGVGAPLCRGHFRGAVCPDYAGLHPDTILLLENDDSVALQLQAAATGEAFIIFADDDFNPPAGIIEYDFADEEMTFGVGTDDMVVIQADGANSRITSVHRGIRIDSPSYAAFIADAHDDDAYFELQEDNAIKWTMGFDFTDALKFQISEGLPGTNVRFEIVPGTQFNFYLDVVFPDGISLTLQEDITFVGATTQNLIKFPDNLPDAFSFMEGANPYQTFITTNGSEAIQFHEDVLLKGSTEYGATNKTTGAWNKSIGAGGDYANWATMIAAMPDLIAHAVTVTIEIGTTLTEICDIKNKHGVTSAGVITIQAERYYPTTGVIPTGDSATATTLRDAALAAEAYGNDYFNGCWVFIVDGTGTDNGYVLITDYVDVTGDVVVAAWPGTQPDNTSRYIIVGALIEGGGTRTRNLRLGNNTVQVNLKGIGMKSANSYGVDIYYNSFVNFSYCGIYDADLAGIYLRQGIAFEALHCGIVKCNTDDTAGWPGMYIGSMNYCYIYKCGISDNNRYGIFVSGGRAIVTACFGDSNGVWGAYADASAQVKMTATFCSGAAGNFSDPGTAGNPNADQAAAY